MKLEGYDVEVLKRELLEIVGRYIDLETHKVFFFGSRVSGRGNERSDIDVGILGKNPLPVETLARIRSDVEELSLLNKIDIVDFSSTEKSFRTVAIQNVEEIIV